LNNNIGCVAHQPEVTFGPDTIPIGVEPEVPGYHEASKNDPWDCHEPKIQSPFIVFGIVKESSIVTQVVFRIISWKFIVEIFDLKSSRTVFIRIIPVVIPTVMSSLYKPGAVISSRAPVFSSSANITPCSNIPIGTTLGFCSGATIVIPSPILSTFRRIMCFDSALFDGRSLYIAIIIVSCDLRTQIACSPPRELIIIFTGSMSRCCATIIIETAVLQTLIGIVSSYQSTKRAK
jgi:hypothetical protein